MRGVEILKDVRKDNVTVAYFCLPFANINKSFYTESEM